MQHGRACWTQCLLKAPVLTDVVVPRLRRRAPRRRRVPVMKPLPAPETETIMPGTDTSLDEMLDEMLLSQGQEVVSASTAEDDDALNEMLESMLSSQGQSPSCWLMEPRDHSMCDHASLKQRESSFFSEAEPGVGTELSYHLYPIRLVAIGHGARQHGGEPSCLFRCIVFPGDPHQHVLLYDTQKHMARK